MTMDQVRKSVESGNQKLSATAGHRDCAAMAALYTEEAWVLPPDGPAVIGRKAIEDFWRATVSSLDLMGVTLSTLDLAVHGDAAFEVAVAQPHKQSLRSAVARVYLKHSTAQSRA